jgi:hypothetical protein
VDGGASGDGALDAHASAGISGERANLRKTQPRPVVSVLRREATSVLRFASAMASLDDEAPSNERSNDERRTKFPPASRAARRGQTLADQARKLAARSARDVTHAHRVIALTSGRTARSHDRVIARWQSVGQFESPRLPILSFNGADDQSTRGAHTRMTRLRGRRCTIGGFMSCRSWPRNG